MSIPLLDDAVRLAYPFVWHLATATGPAGAIVLCTLAVRLLLLPLSVAAARAARGRGIASGSGSGRTTDGPDGRADGGNPFAGCLPLLLQAPFLLAAYRLFLSPTIGGQPNALLHGKLLGVTLSTGLLGGGHLLVFLPFLAALAGLAWLAVRRMRRPAGASGEPAAPPGLVALLPYGTVLTATLVPLAAVLYLVTTTAWTTVENVLLRRPR
jgi:YidC/Oxa1 family membrane protein insertase